MTKSSHCRVAAIETDRQEFEAYLKYGYLEHDFLQAGILADPDKHRPHDVPCTVTDNSSSPWKALFTPQDLKAPMEPF